MTDTPSPFWLQGDEAAGAIARPDRAAHPAAFTATATVCGQPGDFCKFQASGSTPWSELAYVQARPDLVLRDAEGTELIRIEGGGD